MPQSDHNIISIRDFDRPRLEAVLDLAERMEAQSHGEILKGKVMASLFYEPSTRTRLSFESSMKLLGGKVIGFNDPAVSSTVKGESLEDTIRMVQSYSHVIVLRHPLEGSARFAGEVASVPVVNAGDGANQHPTQTFLDLYTIRRAYDRLEDVTIGFLGDLKYGRTVHSLAVAISHFASRLFFISSKPLRMPLDLLDEVKANDCEVVETASLQEVLPELDVLYATRIQKERFADPMEYEREKGAYRIDKAVLEEARPSLKLMHPLPRGDEISTELDTSPHALYFQQAANGIPVRQALLCTTLGVEP